MGGVKGKLVPALRGMYSQEPSVRSHSVWCPRLFPVLMFLGVAACSSQTIDIPKMETSTEDPPEANIELAPSFVSAPVVFDLRPLLAELESSVPRTFGSIEKSKRIQINKGPSAWVAPEIRRGDFDFTFKDNEVQVSTILEYRAKVWVKPLLFEQSVSCGMDKERPRIRLTLATKYDLDEHWHIQTTSRVVGLEAVSQEERDQCEVSIAKINVTGKVVDAARGAVVGMLKKADQRLSRMSIEKPITGIWYKLQNPISIAKGTLFLEINPKHISLGPIKAQDSNLIARLDLLAAPRLVSGEKPVNDSIPLPALGRTSSGTDTAVVLVEGVLAYAAANELLGTALEGKKFGKWWARITIDDVTALPAGKGRIVLAVKVSGRVNGTLWAVGTPAYDQATDMISVPDLAFDVKTQGALAGMAGWLVNGPFLKEVRLLAKIPASTLLENVVEIANRELNRELSKGVFLRGQLDKASARNVIAAQRGLVARAHATGRLWVEISKDNWIPDRRKKATAD